LKRLLLLMLSLPLVAFATGLILVSLLIPNAVFAADDSFEIVIKDHHFLPAELTIPSGTKIKLMVDNQDSTPEEFDSHSLNREKMIAGRSIATIFIGPLSPGRYPFTGEFHATTAQGTIIAK
jgi:hypothetical protein